MKNSKKNISGYHKWKINWIYLLHRSVVLFRTKTSHW